MACDPQFGPQSHYIYHPLCSSLLLESSYFTSRSISKGFLSTVRGLDLFPYVRGGPTPIENLPWFVSARQVK